VVPLYNCLSLTQAMLASLRDTVPASLAYEVIFVDDGSTDGTREWLSTVGPALVAGPGLPTSASPTIRSLLNEKNLGFAATCNRGAAVARGEYLFFLNNDLVLLPGWLEPMLAVFSVRSDAGLVGNVQLNFATGAVDHAGLVFNAKGKPEHVTDPGPRREPDRAVVAVTGACFGIRATTWNQLGGFDEAYVNGCEDVDLGLRARQAGLTNYVALRSVVRHHVSASLGRKLRDEQNTARLINRWRPHVISLMPRACARACLAAAWENPRDYVRLRVAYESFLYAIGLVSRPGPEIVAAASQALDLEAARWAHLFQQAPPPSPHDLAPAWFPARPDKSPV
jgi:GT2 family glycosyltransferase